MRVRFIAFIVAGLLASNARAATFNLGNGQAVPGGADGIETRNTSATTETFGSAHVASDTSPISKVGCGIVHSSVVSIGGDFLIAGGNKSDVRLTPAGDRGCYLSNSFVSGVATSTIMFNVPVGKYLSYVGWYWGSIDPYNYVQFRNGAGAAIANNLADASTNYEVSGQRFIDLNGGALAPSSFVEATFTAADDLHMIRLRDTDYAFELDSLAWQFSPIPAGAAHVADLRSNVLVDAPNSIGLLAGGAMFVGLIRRRRD